METELTASRTATQTVFFGELPTANGGNGNLSHHLQTGITVGKAAHTPQPSAESTAVNKRGLTEPPLPDERQVKRTGELVPKRRQARPAQDSSFPAQDLHPQATFQAMLSVEPGLPSPLSEVEADVNFG